MLSYPPLGYPTNISYPQSDPTNIPYRWDIPLDPDPISVERYGMRDLLIPYHTLIPYPPTGISHKISHIFPSRIPDALSRLTSREYIPTNAIEASLDTLIVKVFPVSLVEISDNFR